MPTGELGLLALGVASLVALGVGLLLVRQSARGVARIRRRAGSSEAFARVAREVDEELDVVVRQVEAVRGGTLAPGEIITLLSETVDALARAGDRAKALDLPAASEDDRQAFLLDLMHAKSALESILDACLELEGSTQAERRERAPTVMKWGHLNLVRAQQSLAEHTIAHDGVARTGVTP